jgi:DNA (cytosine-5)-methyltransferase 1
MVNLLYVDLFCGAGGTTTGVEESRLTGEKCAKVVACVNHDPNAIASHMANHKDVLHFIEDIRTLDTTELVSHLGRMRTEYPEAKVVLWASLECTNFSRAKGGLPRDADSRTLADHLFRYIEDIDPDFPEIRWGDEPIEVELVRKEGKR